MHIMIIISEKTKERETDKLNVSVVVCIMRTTYSAEMKIPIFILCWNFSTRSALMESFALKTMTPTLASHQSFKISFFEFHALHVKSRVDAKWIIKATILLPFSQHLKPSSKWLLCVHISKMHCYSRGCCMGNCWMVNVNNIALERNKYVWQFAAVLKFPVIFLLPSCFAVWFL